MRPTIGLLINNFNDEYQRAVMAGVQSVCLRRDANLICLSGGLGSDSDWERLRLSNLFPSLGPASFDGLLTVSGVLSRQDELDSLADYVRSVLGTKPIVNLGRPHPSFTSIDVESVSSIRALVDHLVVVHGRRRFVFMGGWKGNPDQEERLGAFLEALKAHGLEPVEGGLLTGYFVYEHARREFRVWLDSGRRFDAVIAANDQMAFACFDEMQLRGIEVPEQVSLTGFDDFASAEVFDVPLTTVNQGTGAQAADAAEELLDQIAGRPPSPDRTVTGSPVFRQSCGCFSAETRYVLDSEGPFRLPGPLQQLMSDLFDRFVAGDLPAESFLQALGSNLRRTPPQRRVGKEWDHWVTSLLHRAEAEAWPPTVPALLHQARIAIREVAESRQAALRERQAVQAWQTHIASSHLANSFTRQEFFANLSAHLPRLGLAGCLVVVFDRIEASRQARLIYQLSDGRPVTLPEGGLTYPLAEVVPLALRSQRFSFILESLHNNPEPFGMVLFDFKPGVPVPSDAIGFQVRSALRSVLLMEELEAANRRTLAHQEQLILSEKMAVLGGLVAGISHEINTPLGVAYTAGSLLDEKLADLVSHVRPESGLREALRGLQETNQLAFQSLQKVSDLVSAFKQIAVDLRGDEEREFVLGTYLNEVVQSLAPLYRPGGHTVVVRCPPALKVRSYPGAFLQVLTHLTSNAVVHGFRNRQNGLIEITGLVKGPGLLELLFTDNGQGLGPEGLAHVFEPFYSALQNHEGTGLGTYVVYNLVTQKLGGTIHVTSKIDQGLTYRMEIPLKD